MQDTAHKSVWVGFLSGLVAFVIWGLFPIYWKALGEVNALESLAHRMLWTLVFVAGLLLAKRQLLAAWALLRNRQQSLRLLASALLIAVNWGIYIWAVQAGKVLDASLGYFMTPLINILFGVWFFRERLRPWQLVAVACASLGVLNQVWHVGAMPWIALSVGCSFAAYGAIRKASPVESLAGLFIETLLLAPLALGYLFYLQAQNTLAFLHIDWQTDLLLLGCGLVTAVPLLLYVVAARSLSMASLGLMTYIAPSLQFLLGVFLYAEPLLAGSYVTFGLIWLGLLIYSLETRWQRVRMAPEAL